MKKAYSKPHIVFDSFELSQSIASCQVTTNAVVGTCALWNKDLNMNIFTDSISACDLIAGGQTTESSYGSLCYEIPSGAYNLFSS